MCFGDGLIQYGFMSSGHVKGLSAGEVKPLEETQTAKRKLMGSNVGNIAPIGRLPYLGYTTIRITNLNTRTFDPL